MTLESPDPALGPPDQALRRQHVPGFEISDSRALCSTMGLRKSTEWLADLKSSKSEIAVDGSASGPSTAGFWFLFLTQFQGAFSDNTFKTLALFLLLGMGLAEAERNLFVELGHAAFAAPFILFSLAGGYLADRYSKRSVTVWTKTAEIFVMAIGTLALSLGNPWPLLIVIFLMAAQSAFFGPSKWGLLPELLPERRLSWGNGLIQMGTYTAYILGAVMGGILSDMLRGQPERAGILLVTLASVGLFASRRIDYVPAANPRREFRWNYFAEAWKQVRIIRSDRLLSLAILGNFYFNFIGSFYLLNVLLYGKDILQVTDTENSYLQAAIAVGIGIGSIMAGRSSKNKIEYGLVPLGSIGLCAATLALGQSGLSYPEVATFLFVAGFSGGFFIVPILALIQHRPDKQSIGGVLGAAGLFSFCGVLMAPMAYHLADTSLALGPREIFLASAFGTFLATIFVGLLLPESLVRLFLWLLTNTLYRQRVFGRDHLPERGGALLVINYLSPFDALLLVAAVDRPIHFMVPAGLPEFSGLTRLSKLIHVIPVSGPADDASPGRSLQLAKDALNAGDFVCLFAPGETPSTDPAARSHRVCQQILEQSSAPLVPAVLDNPWGGCIGFAGEKTRWSWPRRMPSRVVVGFGKPLPSHSAPATLRDRVQSLRGDAYHHHREWLQPLHRILLRTARRHPTGFAMADARAGEMNWLTVLIRTIFLGRRLRSVWREDHMVGVFLPPSAAGAFVNYAACLAGKIPVNLNYSMNSDLIGSCISQCEIKTVITSRAFLEHIPVRPAGKLVYLEDLASRPGRLEKLAAAVIALFPASMIERILGRQRRARLDDLATIIFSSGSTGTPKGVMLSHYNLSANLEQSSGIFDFRPADRLLGIMPFFHSIGFTVGLWLPVAERFGVIYHPNPIEARPIGALVARHRITLMISTPTFLQGYTRRCKPEEFASLRMVMTGAEKLPARVALAFQEKFGTLPIEGYGCTECSPVVAANAGPYRPSRRFPAEARAGTIGQPVEGLQVRIVHPETGETLPDGEQGVLSVRGPNVMQGYLGQPERTAAVLRDGWYSTGDVALLDADGYIRITDRLNRFSKIGGEMVPHLMVEETLHELIGATEQVLAVTGVPDEKKGERLVVIHTLEEPAVRRCMQQLLASDLPNLWKPDARDFFHAESIPVMGSGKVDLQQLKKMARERSSRNNPSS